jgi:hypothetical protein
LFVDVRVPGRNPTYSIEVYRMGWYGGVGARQMMLPSPDGPTNQIVLESTRQVIPTPEPATGLVECNWTPSWTFTVPPDWVSGVYLAKLTAIPEGRQSYIVFVVREDDRSSDLLYQCSFTTYEAYNPWGGASAYAYPAAPAKMVSFNRPFAGPASPFGTPDKGYQRLDLAYGTGAGEFLVSIGKVPLAGWEYNAVRWLERQGYDLTYCSSVDTDRLPGLVWPRKSIKAFLSVGHDEYWSEGMRNNVEQARDRGIHLAFLGSNAAYWRIHFDGTRRRFSVNKITTPSGDLWRVGGARAEISLIGTEYVYNSGDLDMRVADPLPAHWVFDKTGVTPGLVLRGMLGYEFDGEWDNYPAGDDRVRPVPPPGTVRLTSTPFTATSKGTTGRAYSTIYQAPSGAYVFGAGSMQWNWGLDDYNATQTGGRVSRVNDVVRQMTHNVLRKFANTGAVTRTLVFQGSFPAGDGAWQGRHGADGRMRTLPDGTTEDRLPWYATATVRADSILTGTVPGVPGDGDGPASGWASSDELVIDLHFTDTASHIVALRCVDLFGAGSQVRIELNNPARPVGPQDLRDLTVPPGGVYFVWKMSGDRQLRIQCQNPGTPGCGAFVSGLFFGGAGNASFGGSEMGTATTGTRGDWVADDGTRVYGHEGYALPSGSSSLPDTASVRLIGGQTLSMGTSRMDVRAPRLVDDSGMPTGLRTLAFWSSPLAPFDLDMDLGGSGTHRVSLYAFDLDGCTSLATPRQQAIEVWDGMGYQLLDRRLLPAQGSDFCQGIYLTWNVSGHVRFRVVSRNGDRSIVSGLFLDPDPFPALSLNSATPTRDGMDVHLAWSSIPGRRYMIEMATDLTRASWVPVSTEITATGTVTRYVHSSEGQMGYSIYRVRLIE